MTKALPVLIPVPQRMEAVASTLPVGRIKQLGLKGDSSTLWPIAQRFAADWRQATGLALDVTAVPEVKAPAIVLRCEEGSPIHPQGYQLTINQEGVEVLASQPVGIFYALATLRQIVRQSPDHLPGLIIDDAPALMFRGVMLDISRSKVPTLDTLFAMVDTLASWKINQVQLYTEHTFAYPQHEKVWAEASPITPQDVLALDTYCRERFIDLVPNQNAFGHMERWLKWPAYADLGICGPEESFPLPWGGERKGGFSLNPLDPRSLALIEGLLDTLLPHFSSRQINIGCDETFDLGAGKTTSACAGEGKGRVYLRFLTALFDAVRRRGFTPQFWGDIILEHPELIAELPKEVIALAWGYEQGFPFMEKAEAFAAAGIPFYVCPGTSSWLSIGGRTTNALANLQEAAQAGLRHGAIGYLNTDWGDQGHWQYLPVSWLPFAVGAAHAWNPRVGAPQTDLEATLNRDVYQDADGLTAGLFARLGQVWEDRLPKRANSATVFYLVHQDDLTTISDLDLKGVRETRLALEGLREEAVGMRPGADDGDLVRREWFNACRLMIHGCRRAEAVLAGRMAGENRALAADMHAIIGEHRALWLARNRPGGLNESVAVMTARAVGYVA
jgi:hexosaminidase